MAKRTKLRNQRPKALFGADGAIMAAATLAAAGIQSAAQYYTGKQQADAALQSAKQQADALTQQNENANRLQTEMMQFTKDQNDQSRQLIKDNQMNLQLMAGAQSMRDRREQSKTIVKYGGSKRRKLRDVVSSFLQGGNIPFRVTDGGGVIPIGQTPEGFDIYKIYGDSHKEYHKSRGGKYKSGVGFKYPDGHEIEGERGELAIATPDNMYFLSRHTRHGFNPAKAVEAGMSPEYAYNIQETYKDIDGIDSEGNHTSPVERRYHASLGGVIPYYNTAIPYNNYTIMPGATAVAFEQSQMNNRRNSLKNGGSVKKQIASLNNRHKLAGGGQWWLSPTIGAVGNILGAGLSSLGIGLGSNYLSKRVGQASDMLANAYGNLKGVDMKEVFGDNFNASFDQGAYMPALRSSYYSADPWLEEVHRNMRRVQGAASNTNGSSAAQLNRLNTAVANAATESGKIYANKANIEEQNKQQQMQAINDAAAHNAQMRIEGIKNVTGIKADLAKYNSGVANESILGAAEARANGLMQQGQIGAQARQGIGSAFGNALAQSGLGFANAYNDNLTRDFELDLAKLGATQEGLTNWYANSNYVSDDQAYAYAQRLLNSAKLSSGEAREKAIQNANLILSSRGYPTYNISKSSANNAPTVDSYVNRYNTLRQAPPMDYSNFYNILGLAQPKMNWYNY